MGCNAIDLVTINITSNCTKLLNFDVTMKL